MDIQRIDRFMELMSEYVPQEVTLKLQDMGYFDKPASIHHHGQYDGALFDHSYEVTKALVDMTEKLGLNWQLERSPYIVGMFHDLCKLDNYIRTDDEHWEYNNATILPGHGEKSVIIAQRRKNSTVLGGTWEHLTIRKIGTATVELAHFIRMFSTLIQQI